jgi:hypothetical protein
LRVFGLRSVMEATTTCTGASQAGKAPACCSIRMPMKRSRLPTMARCSITGWRRAVSVTYSASRRSAMLGSTCIVPHCHWRPSASFSVYSIFGP